MIFPPDSPNIISLERELPNIDQNHLTIDASNAGVILYGSNIATQHANGLQMDSNWCVIQGLQFAGFTGAGVVLSGGAQYNKIGGDRDIGIGPSGQGNVFGDNEVGIGIWDNQTSHNTILGNLIGVDSTRTDAWENAIGIHIEDGGSENIIGPNNIIAYNDVVGISVIHSSSLANTFTQNSIHSNKLGNIHLEEGGNTELLEPFIYDFELATGTLLGTTCSNCTVEFFSASDIGGDIYEGQTTADASGSYTFIKGTPFTGPHLTATATDVNGNTSEFSNPTSGTKVSLALQEGSDGSLSRFLSKPSNELEDNRTGQMTSLHESMFSEEQASGLTHQHDELGLKWHRVSIDMFDWNEVEDTGFYSKHSITPPQDRFIKESAEKGITILYTIVYWDELIQPEGPNYSRFQTEEEIRRYLEYVHFIVNHFKGLIQYYALLNEPNIDQGTQQYVESADYINMVRLAIPIIRQTDPAAKIIIGEVTPLYQDGAWDYLLDILRSDVIHLVDGVAWHDGSESPEYRADDYYSRPAQMEEITQIALTNGFDGIFLPTEVHYRTASTVHPTEYSGYSQTATVKYTLRSVVMFLGTEKFVTGLALEDYGPLVVSSIQNLSTVLAGATPTELSVEIQSETPLIANYNFSLSEGDKLVALWSDGVAVKKDPGVQSTVIIRDIIAEGVVGIDVFNSIEQELVFSHEDGDLVIRELLIRDYPIFLRLEGIMEVVSEH